MSPLVSVIIPSYNHEKFLKERIDSVLNQTFQDFELIILDDLSPDNSREIIESYRAHPKVSQIIYNEKNSGSTFFQWNKAVLSLAKGDFIWIAESDDVADPKFLEALVFVLKNDHNILIGYTQSSRMNENGKITGSWLDWTYTLSEGKKFEHSFIMDGYEYVEKYLIHKNTVPNASAVLFKKSAYIASGGAKTELKTNGDWDLWIKIITQGNVYYHRDELNNFRYHSSSVIAKANTNKIGKIALKIKLYEYDLSLRKSIESYLESAVSNYKKKCIVINQKIIKKDHLYLSFFKKLKAILS